MPIKVRVLEAQLAYADGLSVHTAASGPVTSIRECYVHLSRGGRTIGLGEIRTNIEFLSGIAADDLVSAVVRQVAAMDWSRQPGELLRESCADTSNTSAPVRALLDLTLNDALARAAGLPLCELLGAPYVARVATNQCIFWCDDNTLRHRVRGYLRRGFTQLKLRMGVGDFAHDLRRLQILREMAGEDASIAVDANGAWSLDEATENIAALADSGVTYVEQPTPAGDWQALESLAHRSTIPLMIDEGLRNAEDVEILASMAGAVWAHLKLVKLGGFTPTLAVARTLSRAGVTLQIGQMNEGGAATAAAVHAAIAVGAAHAELYGADGIVDDPCQGVTYDAGAVSVPHCPGLGLDMDPSGTRVLWEGTF